MRSTHSAGCPRKARLAVEEINKAGGFEVGDTTYARSHAARHARRTEGSDRAARKMMEDKIQFVFGPFLSNVFDAIRPIAEQNDKFLMMGGGTSMHEAPGKRIRPS